MAVRGSVDTIIPFDMVFATGFDKTSYISIVTLLVTIPDTQTDNVLVTAFATNSDTHVATKHYTMSGM